jgi:hypothetical protein
MAAYCLLSQFSYQCSHHLHWHDIKCLLTVTLCVMLTLRYSAVLLAASSSTSTRTSSAAAYQVLLACLQDIIFNRMLVSC